MKLWLDDRRRAPAGWTRAYTVAEAQAHLQTGAVDEASLDHDLGACDACMGGLSTEELVTMIRRYDDHEDIVIIVVFATIVYSRRPDVTRRYQCVSDPSGRL